MQRAELKISQKDWFFITFIGSLFGILISLVFYFSNPALKEIFTILFSITTSLVITLYSSVFISFSNRFVLPKTKRRFWYAISFVFSFLSGFLGFLTSFFLFREQNFFLIRLIRPYWFEIAIILGFLTFLIGLILHLFLSMKYRHESMKTKLLYSRLKALENELNPHFLFNALNSISELIYIDQKKSEFALLRLGAFLRNAIKQESLISLKDELEMVKTYIDIENIRFEDKIHLKLEVKESDLGRMLPRFSIQLLAENAIKHGFLGENLSLHVKSGKDAICVSNNGKITKDLHFGTGLHNLQSRLSLLKVGFLEYKTQNEGMEFSIHFKKES